jgi:hypothetical protein
MAKQLVREAYDIWGQSLGYVLAVVPDDFEMTKAAVPQDAPKQFFGTSRELMRAVGLKPPDRPHK